MKLRFRSLLFLLCFFFLLPQTTFACPLCAAALTTGLGLTRYFGVDDLISGVWIGAWIAFLAYLTIHWLEKKEIRFRGRDWLVALDYALIFLLLFSHLELIGHPLNTIFGIDKLLLGMGLGASVFVLFTKRYTFLRQNAPHMIVIPYQKLVMQVVPLALISLLLYAVMR